MPHNEAQAWWADVQHVRESIERRRAGLPESAAALSPPDEPRFSRRAADSLPVMDDLDWSSSLPARSRGRFDHADTGDRRRHADDWGGYDGAWEDSGRGREDSARADEYEDEPFDFDAERAALERDRSDRARSERDRTDREHRGRDRSDRDWSETGQSDRRQSDRRRGERDAASAWTQAHVEPAATAGGPAATALAPPPARRTVQITGRTVAAPALPRLVEVERRRPARRPAERVGPRPDRIALWAVLLGFFLILVAATSSNAATHPAGSVDRAAVALHAPAR